MTINSKKWVKEKVEYKHQQTPRTHMAKSYNPISMFPLSAPSFSSQDTTLSLFSHDHLIAQVTKKSPNLKIHLICLNALFVGYLDKTLKRMHHFLLCISLYFEKTETLYKKDRFEIAFHLSV